MSKRCSQSSKTSPSSSRDLNVADISDPVSSKKKKTVKAKLKDKKRAKVTFGHFGQLFLVEVTKPGRSDITVSANFKTGRCLVAGGSCGSG